MVEARPPEVRPHEVAQQYVALREAAFLYERRGEDGVLNGAAGEIRSLELGPVKEDELEIRSRHARILQPDNNHRRVDMKVFHPGQRPGEPAASPLNPVLYP